MSRQTIQIHTDPTIPATAVNKPTYRRPKKDKQLMRGLQVKFMPQPFHKCSLTFKKLFLWVPRQEITCTPCSQTCARKDTSAEPARDTPLCDANREITVKYNKPVWMSSGDFHVSVCAGKWITKKATAPIA